MALEVRFLKITGFGIFAANMVKNCPVQLRFV